MGTGWTLDCGNCAHSSQRTWEAVDSKNQSLQAWSTSQMFCFPLFVSHFHWGQMQILWSLQSWSLLLPEHGMAACICQSSSPDIVSLESRGRTNSFSFRLLLTSQSQWGFARLQSLHSCFFAAFWPAWCCQERWLRLLISIQPGWLVLSACWGLDTCRHSRQNVFYGQMQPRSKENTSMKDCRSSLWSFSAITIEHLGIWTNRSATNWKLQRCHLWVLQSWSMAGSDSSNGN